MQIDLVANPAGLASPDQSTPKELKNPIHLKTRDLVFNQDTGNASTDARVEFQTPQATGWAVGVKYAGKSNTLTLASQIHVVLAGSKAAVIDAHHGVITNEPRDIVLDHPHLERDGGITDADQAVFHLGHDERRLAAAPISAAVRFCSTVACTTLCTRTVRAALEVSMLTRPARARLYSAARACISSTAAPRR